MPISPWVVVVFLSFSSSKVRNLHLHCIHARCRGSTFWYWKVRRKLWKKNSYLICSAWKNYDEIIIHWNIFLQPNQRECGFCLFDSFQSVSSFLPTRLVLIFQFSLHDTWFFYLVFVLNSVSQIALLYAMGDECLFVQTRIQFMRLSLMYVHRSGGSVYCILWSITAY